MGQMLLRSLYTRNSPRTPWRTDDCQYTGSCFSLLISTIFRVSFSHVIQQFRGVPVAVLICAKAAA